MKKITKILGTAGAIALAAGLVPYHYSKDEKTGAFEIGGLLWTLKKDVGEDEDTYTVELLPFINKEEAAPAPAEAAEAAEPVEEPFAETESEVEVVVESVEDAVEAAESAFHAAVAADDTVEVEDVPAPETFPSEE